MTDKSKQYQEAVTSGAHLLEQLRAATARAEAAEARAEKLAEALQTSLADDDLPCPFCGAKWVSYDETIYSQSHTADCPMSAVKEPSDD